MTGVHDFFGRKFLLRPPAFLGRKKSCTPVMYTCHELLTTASLDLLMFNAIWHYSYYLFLLYLILL